MRTKNQGTSTEETTYYLYGVTGLMSEFVTKNTGAQQAASNDAVRYIIPEHNGTPALIVDPSGDQIETNRRLPFGEKFDETSPSTNDQKFTTYDRDAATELDYAMARWYSSREGRFISTDPGHAGADPKNPQTWNLYVYVTNDPISYIDPSGLSKWGWLAPEAGISFGDYGTFIGADGAFWGEFGGDTHGSDGGMEVSGVSQAGSNVPLQERLMEAAEKAHAALGDRECSKLFGRKKRSADPQLLLFRLFYETTTHIVEIGPMAAIKSGKDLAMPNATTSARLGRAFHFMGLPTGGGDIITDMPRWGAHIIINDEYSGSSRELAYTLLHELGHVYNLTQLRLGGSSLEDDGPLIPNWLKLSQNNTDLVSKQCKVK